MLDRSCVPGTGCAGDRLRVYDRCAVRRSSSFARVRSFSPLYLVLPDDVAERAGGVGAYDGRQPRCDPSGDSSRPFTVGVSFSFLPLSRSALFHARIIQAAGVHR